MCTEPIMTYTLLQQPARHANHVVGRVFSSACYGLPVRWRERRFGLSTTKPEVYRDFQGRPEPMNDERRSGGSRRGMSGTC
jgi:hypothetical protein